MSPCFFFFYPPILRLNPPTPPCPPHPFFADIRSVTPPLTELCHLRPVTHPRLRGRFPIDWRPPVAASWALMKRLDALMKETTGGGGARLSDWPVRGGGSRLARQTSTSLCTAVAVASRGLINSREEETVIFFFSSFLHSPHSPSPLGVGFHLILRPNQEAEFLLLPPHLTTLRLSLFVFKKQSLRNPKEHFSFFPSQSCVA